MSEPMALPVPAWNRRPGESARAFEAARLYFEMGSSRSLAAVARKLNKSLSLIERWSKHWGWVERAAAFDDHLTEQQQREFEREEIARRAKWRQRADEEPEAKFELGQNFKRKAKMMMEFPLTSVTKEDGKTVIRPGKWTFTDIPRFAEMGTKLTESAIEDALGDTGGVVPEEFVVEDYK